MSLRKRGRWAHVALGPERYESLEDGSVSIWREHDALLCKACAIERADEIDGLGTWEWPRSRLGVNPDRHARIRQKHFHGAQTRIAERRSRGHVDGVHSAWLPREWDYRDAFDACDWGTR